MGPRKSKSQSQKVRENRSTCACGRTFTSRHPKRVTCGRKKCLLAHRREWQRANYALKPKKVALAKICPVCDEKFSTHNPLQEACWKPECQRELKNRKASAQYAKDPKKNAARTQAWRDKHGEEQNARNRARYAKNPTKYIEKRKTYHRVMMAQAKANPRPADWHERPIEWRIVGTELLSRPRYMSNQELAKRLDSSRIIKCPYPPEKSWGDAIGRNDCKKFIQNIRRWINRPGKNPALLAEKAG